MKTAISVPDETFRRVEQRASELGMNRSEFYATAAERYLDELDNRDLSQHIDEALERSSGRSTTDVPAAGLARLAELTAEDDW